STLGTQTRLTYGPNRGNSYAHEASHRNDSRRSTRGWCHICGDPVRGRAFDGHLAMLSLWHHWRVCKHSTTYPESFGRRTPASYPFVVSDSVGSHFRWGFLSRNVRYFSEWNHEWRSIPGF